MTSLTGSPGKSDLINSRMQEYMKNLNKDTQPVLKQLSSSRINSSSNLKGTLNSTKSPGSSYRSSPGKENFSGIAAELLSVLNKSPTKPSYFGASNAGTNKVNNSSPSKLSSKDNDYQEFLIRVEEAKQWIEAIIQEEIPSALDLATTKCMCDGVYLAKLVAKVKPELVKKIVPAGDRLVYAHTQNINSFLELVNYVEVPDLFKFELNDLYDRKNIPKVFETIHGMASILSAKYGTVVPQMQDMTGLINSPIEDIKLCQRKVPGVHTFRSFNQFSSKPSSPKKGPQKGLLDSVPLKSPVKISDPKESQLSIPEPPKTPTRYPSAIVHDIQQSDLSTSETKHLSLSYLKSPSPQRLTYSPDRTFSYYSPGVSRNLSYRTEDIGYFNRKRQQWNYDFDYYDTYRYGSSNQFSPQRREKMTETEFLDTVTHLQALLKGLNTRFAIHLKIITLEHRKTRFAELQALCKSAVVRNKYTKFIQSHESNDAVANLQAHLKGTLQRNALDLFRLNTIKRDSYLSYLKVYLKGGAQRKLAQRKIRYRLLHGNSISQLQAVAKANLQRAIYQSYKDATSLLVDEICELQSLSRGRAIRLSMKEAQGGELQIQLQALLKGRVQRTKLQEIEETFNDNHFQRFGSFIKGYVAARKYTVAPTKVANEVVSFNAIIKGMLTRFAMELIVDVAESNNVNLLQAKVLGYIVRRQLTVNRKYYDTHKSAVVTIQKNIKRYQLQNAYRALTSTACPSLSTVRKFVHILNQSDNEVFSANLQKLKANINDINEEIGELQESLQKRIVKKDSLEKRKIDVSKFLTSAGRQQLQLQFNNTNNDNLKKSLEYLYGKIGFLLQVDSFYWSILIKEDPKFCVTNLPKLFAPLRGSIGERENSLYIKIIGDLLSESIDDSPILDVFLSEDDAVWSQLLQNYLTSFKNKDILSAFSQLYKYLDSNVIDFESDPSKVYANRHPTHPPQPANVAIEDPDTNNQFVKNMTSLWAAVDLVCSILDNMVLSERSELKYLASRAYRSSANKDASETSSLSAITKIVVDNFISVALLKRANFSSADVGVNYYSKAKILLETLKVVFGSGEFEGYYSPLNQYLIQSQDQFTGYLTGLLIEPEENKRYETIVYKDMANSSKPSLMLYHQTFIKILEKLEKVVEELPHDDPMLKYLSDIQIEFDKASVNGQSQLTIVLDPSAYKVTLNNSRSDLMYTEAKQGLCYLMQIEEVNSNLTDLLVSQVLPEDEIAFQTLISEHPSIANTLSEKHGDFISYSEFKKLLMYRIKELTVLGIIDKSNDYQFLLVDIANTIKTRSCIKGLNRMEMDIMVSVYNSLQEKLSNIKLLQEAMDTAISKSIKELQSLHNYTPAKKSGLGHKLKDVYQKSHKKSQEADVGISYKWSSKQLLDQGVLLKITGSGTKGSSVSFFGSSGSKTPCVDFKFSTRDGEVFGIEMIDSKNKLDSNLQSVVKFSDLVEKEAEDSRSTISIFERKDKTVIDVAKLLDLLVDSFFRF
ncbi:unnamed protein product [Kluyveromyces dobzhanskii CBS 2104]|uniref:WGS project CCBQ000000000 data, contig 00102 n=1 Tax=Kluyveromyces dobzhanskii CBS 2104 TaxID=1427455 RepID=A0A0A8L6U9_9SACH|nr:unnamed protein product [Kluyveromyces dobzhanskii CBS 2104]